MNLLLRTLFTLMLAALAGCGSANAVRPPAQTFSVGCASTLPNAFHVGPYKGTDDKLPVEYLIRDLYCADQFKKKYPRGFVTVFGSSKVLPKNTLADASYAAANDRIYKDVYGFARRWTEKHGKRWPILTGGGGGLMGAAAGGATDGGGPSIGYITYYGESRNAGGQPELAFATRPGPDGSPQPIISDGLIFSSVAIREYALILHSAAVVIAPGGAGTEWEIFQVLESIKSAQLGPVPVYLLGQKRPHWESFEQRVRSMEERGMVNPGQLQTLFVQVDTAEQLLERLETDLMPRHAPDDGTGAERTRLPSD